MGFLKDTLLGTKSEVDTQSLSTLTPEQQKALNTLLGFLGDPSQAEQFGKGLELTSLQALEDLSRSFAQPGGGPLEGANTAIQQLLQGASGDTANIDRFFQEAVAAPVKETFFEDILPQTSARFAESGFRSSDRLKQENKNVEELVQALTQGGANFAFQAREGQLNRALGAAQVSPQLAALPVEIQNIINQASKRAEAQRFQALLGAINTQGVENLATVTPGQPGAIQEFISGFAGNAGKAFAGGKNPFVLQ